MNMRESLIGNTRRLAHIRRYSSYPVIRPENVAEHSFYVALYGMMVAEDLRRRGYVVDLGLVAQKAISHDISEALTGDVVRSFKYATDYIHEAISMTEQSLTERSMPDFLHDLWCEAKDSSIEGRIIAFADVLCVVAYMYEEWLSGNRHMRVVTKEAKDFILKFTEDAMFRPYRGDLTVILREILDGGF